jgi:hypothetical protein
LDGFRAADKALSYLHASDTTLTQLHHFLAHFSRASVILVFVFDGPDRSPIKRGRRVINREPVHYKLAKELIEHYGYYIYMVLTSKPMKFLIMLIFSLGKG